MQISSNNNVRAFEKFHTKNCTWNRINFAQSFFFILFLMNKLKERRRRKFEKCNLIYLHVLPENTKKFHPLIITNILSGRFHWAI